MLRQEEDVRLLEAVRSFVQAEGLQKEIAEAALRATVVEIDRVLELRKNSIRAAA